MTRTLIFTFLFIGSIIGSSIPLLWGGSPFSLSSVFWSTIGGFAGISIGYSLGRRID
jgi:membrane protein DedA with SNARE-associated domain